MKIRNTDGEEKIELQMTPMIDIVFQLLVFFIMTFNIVAQEGDFNIKMPQAAVTQNTSMEDPPEQLTLVIHLSAGADGNLSGVTLNKEAIPGATVGAIFDELNSRVIAMTASNEPGEGSEGEVELGFDYQLKYENVIAAITAVTGYIDKSTGKPVKLIEKIKFAAPSAPGG